MPRSRNIKYSFFTNDELAENDALGRLLFIGLWTLSDCNGNIEWRPKRIKAELLPYDDCDVESLAINLDKSGFIRFYSVQGKTLVNIVNFLKHQNPHKNERDKGSDTPKYSEEARQAIDIQGLTINPDKIEIYPDSNGTDPAVSCILIPDTCSLIPKKKPLSGKPSIDGQKSVIDYLNLKSGSNYQPVDSNIKLITGRMAEGRTVEEIKQVIDRQCLEWPPDHHMRKYLRPKTLFNAEKFNQYFGQLGQPINTEQQNGQSQRFNQPVGEVARIQSAIDVRAKARYEAIHGEREGIHEGGASLE